MADGKSERETEDADAQPTKGPPREFWDAIDKGNVDTLRRMLTRNPRFADYRGSVSTPLSCAISKGHKEVAKLLVERGADVNAFLPLVAAACSGQVEVTRLLLEKGALPNNVRHGETVTGRVEQRRHLALRDEQVSEETHALRRKAILALLRHHGGKTVKELTVGACSDADRKAMLEVRDKLKDDPKWAAEWRAHDGSTLLHMATEEGYLGTASLVIANGVAVDATREDGGTALNVAADAGQIPMLAFLAERGADVNVRDAEGRTLLHHAVSQCKETVVDALLAAKADVNLADKDGSTPLHVAASMKQHEAFNIRLRRSSGYGKPGVREELKSKIRGIQLQIVTALLENGAAVNAVDKNAETPLSLAVQSGNKEIARLLASRKGALARASGRVTTPLHRAASNAQPAIVRDLLEFGAHADAQDEMGNTPLHLTTEQWSVCGIGARRDAMPSLSGGLDSPRSGRPGPNKEALEMKRRYLQVAEILLAHGADPNSKTDGGRKVWVAAQLMAREDRRMLDLLRKHGAEVPEHYGGLSGEAGKKP